MHGGPGKFVYLILAIFIIIDIYAFKGLKILTANFNNQLKIILTVIYWLVPAVIFFLTFYIMGNLSNMAEGKLYYRTFYTFMAVMVLFYVPKLIFCCFELGNDITNLVLYFLKKIRIIQNGINIQYLRYAGTFIAMAIFIFTFYGILHGRYHYKINHLKLSYSNLPQNFNGYRIVHVSDWHIGSYYRRTERIKDAVEKINKLEPDIILFTGDLVNNLASEIEVFIPVLKELKARYGIYSVLGNHDYGEYVHWSSNEAAANNLKQLKEFQSEIGFKLLNNESVIIEKDSQRIGIAGVENWGLPPFPQYGDLDLALQNISNLDFKILLSHDPSHWDAEIRNKTDVDLTLSGHTHGMQFGMNLGNFKWSPVKYKYPRWAGLYEEQVQKLFVSVGIGYIGFPGRVGIRPEIAVIELVTE